MGGLQKTPFDAGVEDASDSEEKDSTGPFMSPTSNWSPDEKEEELSVAWEKLSGEVAVVRGEPSLVRLVTALTNDPVPVAEGVAGSDESSDALTVDKVESEDTERVALEIVGAKLTSLCVVEAAGEEAQLDDVGDLSLAGELTRCVTCWLLAT